MPLATAAAEPLLDPPGVHSRFQGLRVPRGAAAANSVVTVLPRMRAPACRSAATLAASFCERQPANSGEPISVGMSAVSMMSLTPIGMPSIGESGAPALGRPIRRRPRTVDVEIDEGANLRLPAVEIGETGFQEIARAFRARCELRCTRQIGAHARVGADRWYVHSGLREL